MSLNLDCIFVFLNTPYGDLNGFSYHTGTARIIWNMRRNGLTAEQYYREKIPPFPELAEDILRKKPKFVGFSCYDVHFPLVATIASHLKRKCSSVRIVIGGPTAMFSDEVILTNYPQIDFCIRGEGEETILELFADVPLDKISGLSFIQDGIFRRNPDRQNLNEEKLNTYPSIYTDGLIPLMYSNRIGIMTSTGCAYQCTYCQFSVLTGRRVRFYSDEHVLNDLYRISQFWETHHNSGVTIPIVDEAFTLNKERALRLCRAIENMKLPITLSCGTRGDHVDEEILEAMWSAGIRALFYGLESGAPNVLANIEKAGKTNETDTTYRAQRIFIESIKRNVALAKKRGFDVSVSTIFGLPGESYNEAMQTLELIRELNVPYMHNILQVYRGTKLWCDKDKYGINTSKFNGHWHIPHNTIGSYDVTKVPIIIDKDRVFSNMRRNEILAVLTSLVGREQNPSVISIPILMRSAMQSSWKKSLIGLQGDTGTRLVLCDMGGYEDIAWLDDFVFPTSPPILLKSDFNAALNAIEITRVAPLLSNTQLGYSVLLINASKIFGFTPKELMLSVNADTMSGEHHAFVVFFGMCDIPVLTRLAEAIDNEEVIIYRHDTNLIRVLFGDVLTVTAAEGQEPEGKRLCFGRDDCSFNQAGLLFKELDVLRSSQLQNYGILNSAAFLIRLVRVLQLVTFNSEISLNGGDLLLFKMTSSGILGFHQGNAIRYNSIYDTLELFRDTPL